MTEQSVCAVDPELALADRVGTALVRLNKMHALVAHQMSKAGMDKAAFVLIATLAQLGPSRSSVLAEAVLSDPSTISRQVAVLVKDGLIERRADPADGRASVLAVTAAGIELLHERRKIRNVALTRVFDDWTEQEFEQFAGLFERFVQDYERAIPAFFAEKSELGARTGGEK